MSRSSKRKKASLTKPPPGGGGFGVSTNAADEAAATSEDRAPEPRSAEERGWGFWREQRDGEREERAFLIAVQRKGRRDDEALDELARLAEAAGARVVGRVVQQLDGVNPRAYLGRGKIVEVAASAKDAGATLVVADDDLTPSQERHLSDDLGVRVLDRSGLILDIFAQRARTSVAKAQVELAQLEYFLPRLAGLWEHLSRLGGGIGTRGPGETQLEVDRRRVRERIHRLRRELEKVEQNFGVQRQSGRDLFHVALVGYTNAGKSTLMNALTGAGVATGDRLFETLDTTTRVWNAAPGAKVLLSDTVGFVRRLPHRLVASFHATLGEVREADLLLHVVDASAAAVKESMATVRGVLEEIGAGEKPALVALNKVDRVDDPLALAEVKVLHPGALAVSALTGEGLPALAETVLAERARREAHARVVMPIAASRALAFFHRHGRVEEEKADAERMELTVRIAPAHLMKIARETDGLRWEEIRPAATTAKAPGSSDRPLP